MRGLPSRSRAWPLIPIVAAVVGYLWWQLAHLGPFQYTTNFYPLDDSDDWRYTACSRLVAQGYHLFTQVFSAQPPVLFLSLAGGMRLLGQTLTSAQVVEVLYGLVCLACVVYLAWSLLGPIAGAASALLLVLSPAFLVYSHAVEAEGPMACLVTLSLALVVLFGQTSRQGFLLLAGLSLAAAILTKFFAVEAFAPVAYLLYLGAPTLARYLRLLLLYAAAALLPVAIEMLLVAPSQQWSQVVAMHTAASQLDLPGVLSLWALLFDLIRLDPGLWLLACTGAVLLAVTRAWETLVFITLWLGGMIVMLDLFHPLFPHHLAILLPALALPASAAPALALTGLGGAGRYVMTGLTLLYLILLPRLIHTDRHILLAGLRPPVAAYASVIDRATRPGDFVAADDVAIAVQARRDVPPPLCDPSNVRLRSGYLTAGTLIHAISRYHARSVVSSLGIYVQVPQFMVWVRHQYHPLPGTNGHVFVRN